ncbi:MAG: DNA repair protein RadC, partial [Muribaculaceae bacterium]|nr:DNA repair protein RadC [Muribaculaceae bacterium]
MNNDPIATPPGTLIADLAPEQRPREKALRHGIKSLSDAELMALIFATGIKGKSVVSMCQEILADNSGHISRVADMDVREFMRRYKGIGPAKALTLLAALELGTRSVADRVVDMSVTISSSQAGARYMNRFLGNLSHEEFWVLMLRHNLTVIREFRVGQGGMAMTVVDIRILMREILLSKASAVMLFHNHPSGNLEPSSQDLALTRRIKDALGYFDIRLLDHIILA